MEMSEPIKLGNLMPGKKRVINIHFQDYKQIAIAARKKVLEMIYRAQTSHIGSNFSCIDILSVLFEKMNPEKDEFIASKGWIAASVYYFLAQKGIIPKEDLERYCQPGETEYIGLIEPQRDKNGKLIFGLKFAGGSMGTGFPAGVGFALAKKLKGEEGKVYVLMSDGEMQIGTTWESALIAAHHKLDNLVVIADYNKWQATGRTNEVLNLEPLMEKWRAFGWKIMEVDGNEKIDGHNYKVIEAAINNQDTHKHDPGLIACKICGKRNTAKSFLPDLRPCIIVAYTIKGKGVSFMEDKLEWHYKTPSREEYKLALKELNKYV